MSKKIQAYAKIYSTYSGADTNVLVNDTVIPEVQEFQYTELLRPTINEDNRLVSVIGAVHTILLGHPTILDALAQTKPLEFDKLVVCLSNEYRRTTEMHFSSAVFTKRTGRLSPDQVVVGEVYHFEAASIYIKVIEKEEEVADDNDN